MLPALGHCCGRPSFLLICGHSSFHLCLAAENTQQLRWVVEPATATDLRGFRRELVEMAPHLLSTTAGPHPQAAAQRIYSSNPAVVSMGRRGDLCSSAAGMMCTEMVLASAHTDVLAPAKLGVVLATPGQARVQTDDDGEEVLDRVVAGGRVDVSIVHGRGSNRRRDDDAGGEGVISASLENWGPRSSSKTACGFG